MIVGATYDGDSVVLFQEDGSRERIPFTPRILVPTSLAPYLPHHLETIPAPGGLYVEAPYPTLLRLYPALLRLSPAVLFPPPERQYLLLSGLRPFTEGLRPHLPTPSSALFHLLYAPDTPSPALTFVENVLFLEGYARPLARTGRTSPSPDVYYPFFQFNLDPSARGGEILLPVSLVSVRGPLKLNSIHPALGTVLIRKEGEVTLVDALLHRLPYTLSKPLYQSSEPSFLHKHIYDLFLTLKRLLRSYPRGLEGDTTSYNMLLAVIEVLKGLPDILVNTDVLTGPYRQHLIALLRLLRRDPNLYNDLAPSIDTCCPALRGLASSLPALYSSLTEPLPS